MLYANLSSVMLQQGMLSLHLCTSRSSSLCTLHHHQWYNPQELLARCKLGVVLINSSSFQVSTPAAAAAAASSQRLPPPAVRPPTPLQAPRLGLPLGPPRATPKPTFRPTALRLDDQGREIDEFGNLVQTKTESVTTLKVAHLQADMPNGHDMQSRCSHVAWSHSKVHMVTQHGYRA